MVVVDEDEDTKVRTPATSETPLLAGQSSDAQRAELEPPPAYSSSSQSSPDDTLNPYKRGEVAWKRFLRAFAVAVLLYAFVLLDAVLLVGSIRASWDVRACNFSLVISNPKYLLQESSGRRGRPVLRDDGRLDKPGCLTGGGSFEPRDARSPAIEATGSANAAALFKTSMNFSLPVSSDELYFLQVDDDDSLMSGAIHFVTYPNDSQEEVLVDVTISRYQRASLATAKVCLEEQATDSTVARGITISVSLF